MLRLTYHRLPKPDTLFIGLLAMVQHKSPFVLCNIRSHILLYIVLYIKDERFQFYVLGVLCVLLLLILIPSIPPVSVGGAKKQNWTPACIVAGGELQFAQRLNNSALPCFCNSTTTISWNELPGPLFEWMENLHIGLHIMQYGYLENGILWMMASIKSLQILYFLHHTSVLY